MFGPAPDPPPVLHTAPRAGYRNPQFPMTHAPTAAAPYPEFDAARGRQPEPSGNYRSQIDTRSPLDAGKRAAVRKVRSPYTKPGYAASQSLALGGSGRSVAALGRALSDLSDNALNRGMEQFDSQYRTEAEQARAEDVQSQRQNTFDRFRMDMMKAMYDADTWSRWASSKEDLRAHYQRELANSKSIVTQAVTRGLMGMLGSFI